MDRLHSWRLPPRLFAISFVFLVCFVVPSLARAGDWAHWRGPEQTGVSREKDLPEKWSLRGGAGSNLLWKVPVGGRSTPIVMNGRVYVIGPVGEGLHTQERVVCLDAKTGQIIWEQRFNVFLTDIVEARVGWTNVAADPETGNVYAHGVQGLLFCFDGATGKIKWQKSLTEEYGRTTGYGGRVTSPIIDEDKVILGMVNSNWGEYARGGVRFLAMDKKTGDVIWWAETGLPPKDTYYSNPTVAVIGGQRLLISGGGDGGVHAFKVRTGEKVWSYLISTGAVNVTPVVDGDLVYVGHGEENLTGGERGMLVCLNGAKVTDGKPELVWKVEAVQFKYPSPVLHEGKLYIADDGATLYCYDAKTGKELWNHSYGTSAKGSPVWADGKIYVASVDRKFSILKPSDTGCEVLDKKDIRSRIPGVALEINGGVAVADGRVYFMTSQDLYCLGKPEHTAKPDPIPEKPKEEKPPADAKAAHLQVVPADVTLAPGGSATFQAFVYDDKGRRLRQVKAEWETAPFLAPPPIPGVPVQPGPPPPMLQGTITADGKLTVAKLPGQFGGVVAKAEGLTGRARIRVAPQLPYVQDFEKVPENRTPGGWVNAQGKFLVQQLKDGGKVLAKNNTNPSTLVAKANTYFTMPEIGDYTIEAEVMGTLKKDYLPDIGLINSRYMLVLSGVGQKDGVGQKLRLMSWEALPRVDQTIAFAWRPDIWYHMKLCVQPAEGKALVKGKVWEKGKEEPREWTVTFEDPTPNLVGAPGLHGFSPGIGGPTDPGAVIYYDNIKVTPNKK